MWPAVSLVALHRRGYTQPEIQNAENGYARPVPAGVYRSLAKTSSPVKLWRAF